MIRRLISPFALFVWLTFSAYSAHAHSVELLNFNYLQNGESVANFYNGGSGDRHIPNFGVTFSPNFFGLKSVLVNGGGNYMPDPTQSPIIYMSGAMGSNATGVMNAARGFSSGINFFYTSTFTETVTVWSGAFGSGNVLATINLSPDDANCSSIGYCNWTNVGLKFSGTAESVTFSGPANSMGLADITLGETRSAAVPEPSTLYLLGTGLICFGAQSMRRWMGR